MRTGWIDLIRTLAIAHGISVFILTVLVLVRYSQLLMKRPSYSKKNRRMSWHILSLSLSYLLTTVYVCVSVIDRLGEPLSYRLPLAFISFILGNVGLSLAATHIKDEMDEQYRF